jgi:putative sigma-54 modulation protein
MKIEITGRHIEVTEPLRKFAADRLEKMRGAGGEIDEVHIILTVEKHQRHTAEANVKTRHDFHSVQETSSDMYTSIASALDKVERQVLRSKKKTISRKRHGESQEAAEPEA